MSQFAISQFEWFWRHVEGGVHKNYLNYLNIFKNIAQILKFHENRF